MPPSPASRTVLVAVALLVLACLASVPLAGAAPSIAGKKSEIAELGRQVAELDVRVGAAAQAHNMAIDRLDAARGALLTTRRELRIARSDLERARALLAERIVGVYVTGQPSFVELLLTSGSLTEAEQADDLLDQIARGDAGAVTRVRERRARLEGLEARHAEAEAARRRELAVAADRQAEVTAVLSERRRVLAGARAELKRLVKEERERRARLAALARARQAALNSIPVAGTATLSGALPPGSYLFPVAGPTTFSNDWLNSRAGGRYHQGIDLFAARGTPVVAVADGSLFNVGYNGLGGWRLWVRDGSGNTFYYAHLSAYAPAATEGASVARGTVIGYVGDTGDARGTSPHLHFEIHPGGGGPVPPHPIVSGWPRAG
jgi:murein DD-endopeptidase MepM/ murein hydrolase activator NlpD